MKKIFTIAAREYRATVGTKAFLISVTIMPILMFGGIIAMESLENISDSRVQKIVVIDQTGKLFEPLQAVAEAARPDEKAADADAGASNPGSADDTPADTSLDDFAGGGREGGKGPQYVLEKFEGDSITDEQRWELSEKIRRQEIYAFVEIPADVLETPTSAELQDANFRDRLPRIHFHSEDSGLSDVRTWLETAVNELIKVERLREAGIDPVIVGMASVRVPVRGLGLLERTPAGEIRPAVEKDDLLAILVPLGVMLLMFMVIFMAAQPGLESVLEEKSHRIAEVLLGSANPTQLMAGKLLGTVGGSLTILAIYLGGGFLAAWYRGFTEYLPLDLVPWFLPFQIGGVLLYASMFLAIGASVTQLKEAQSMLMPVWLLMMSPMFIWLVIVRDPNGPLATWFSFFPPATATMMMLRMSTGATIPPWQPWVGLVILLLATALCVFIAARIFRVGLLWQGKSPRLGELLKWALRG
jgi:ABC-type Na+ efflux pump permease subunit